MAATRDDRPTGTVAGRIGRFLLHCLTAVLVPAVLILVIAIAWYFGVRPLYWTLWGSALPRPLVYGITGVAMVLLPLALFWIVVGVPRLMVRLARRARR